MTAERNSGFTLIEIAVVLVVVGLLLAGSLYGLAPVVQQSRVNQTNSKLDRIEVALLAYVMQNGCLPCPANGTLGSTDASGDAGWSESNTPVYYGPNGPTNQPCASGTVSAGTGCSGTIGVVPWNTLGLKDSDTVDPWGDRISYAVDSSLTITPGTSMVRQLPTSYPTGSLTVDNNSAAQQTTTGAYVLISHGSDRAYAYAALNGTPITDPNPVAATNEKANNPAGVAPYVFHQDQAVLIQGAGYFDDIVRYQTAGAIIVACGKNACGNPP